MRTSKKILSFFLAVVMVVTTCSIGFTAYAVDNSKSIWTTDCDADSAYATLDGLANMLPSLLMGIDALKDYVANPVYEKYAKEMNKTADQLTQAEKDAIKDKANMQDVLGSLQPLLLQLLAGTDQKDFPAWFERAGISGYDGSSDPSAYNFMVPDKEGTMSIFTIMTICYDYRNNTDLSPETRKQLGDWYDALYDIAMLYINEKQADSLRRDQLVSIMQRINGHVITQPDSNKAAADYTFSDATLYDFEHFDFNLTAEEQEFVASFYDQYNEMFKAMNYNIKIDTPAKLFYYGLGRGYEIANSNGATYAMLIEEGGSAVNYKETSDIFNTGINVDYNITENMTPDNFDGLLVAATGMTASELVEAMLLKNATDMLDGKTVDELEQEKADIQADAEANQTICDTQIALLNTNLTKWFKGGTNRTTVQNKLNAKTPPAKNTDWDTYCQTTYKKNVQNALAAWIAADTIVKAAPDKIAEIDAKIAAYNDASAAVADKLANYNDEYLASFINYYLVPFYTTEIILKGESVENSPAYTDILMGIAKHYGDMTSAQAVVAAKAMMPNDSKAVNISQADFEALQLALAIAESSGIDAEYWTGTPVEFSGMTLTIPDSVKGTSVAEYFAMIDQTRSNDTTDHRLGLYSAFTSYSTVGEAADAIQVYFDEAYNYALTKVVMNKVGATAFLSPDSTRLPERMDFDRFFSQKLSEGTDTSASTTTIDLTAEQKAVINGDYDFTGTIGTELLNLILNNTVVDLIVNTDILGKSITDLLNGFLDTPVDLVVAVSDIWERVYTAPVQTIFELLPLVLTVVNEVVEPVLFNSNEDSDKGIIASVLDKGLLADFMYDAGSYVGIHALRWNLNKLLPDLMNWLMGNKEGIEYYKEETVMFKTYETDWQVKDFKAGEIDTADLKNYVVKDKDGNEVTRTDYDNGVTTFSYLGMVSESLDEVLAQNPKAIFNYYFTYEGTVPKITNIYIADKAIRNARISDMPKLLKNLTKNDTLGQILGEVVIELGTLFTEAVNTYVNTPALVNQIKCLPSGANFSTESTGLNNLLVAIPQLFDIMENLAADKYHMDKNAWTYCYDGKIITKQYEEDGVTYDLVRNAKVEKFKSYAASSDPNRSIDIFDCFADIFVGDWLNAILSILNNVVSENNDIAKNLPIVAGLLNALGGFGEESILTDILNGVFQLDRDDKYSFTLEKRENGLTGLSKDHAYFLITNVTTLVDVVKNLIAHFGSNDTATASEPAVNSAKAAVTPRYQPQPTKPAKASSSTYTKSELSNATDLINNLDKLLSSLLSDSTLNDFSLDKTDNILAGLVTTVENYLGADCYNDIIKLVNSYTYFITGREDHTADADHNVDAKKVYTNDSLTGLVVETYLLVEKLAENLLAKFNDDYTMANGGTAQYNLLVEAIEGLISPDAISVRLSGYDDAQKKLAKYNCWHNAAATTSRGQYKISIDWGIKAGDKDAFYAGLSASLRLVTSILGVLLVDTGYYATIVMPVLNALCKPNGIKVDTVAQYSKLTNGYHDEALLGLLRPLSAFINQFLNKPATTLIKTVQGIAGILDDNTKPTIASILGAVTTPLAKELNGLGEVFAITSSKLTATSPTLQAVLEILADKITGLIDVNNIKLGKGDYTYVLSGKNLVPIINSYLASTGITLKQIDWAKLSKASTPAAALVYVVEYLLEVLLDNENLQAIAQLIDGGNGIVSMIIDAIKSAKIQPKDLLAIINQLLEVTDSPTLVYWSFAQYLLEITENFKYPKGITKAMADKSVESLDDLVAGIFPLLSTFGVDLGGNDLNAILNSKLFTNKLLTTIATALYGALDKQSGTVKDILGSVGIVTSTKDVAKILTDKSYGKTYSAAAKAIASKSSWSDVKNVNWGFKDGSANAQQSFVNALVAILRPLDDILEVFLSEGTLEINDILYDIITSIEVKRTETTLNISDDANKPITTKLVYSMKNGVFTLKFKEDPKNRQRSQVSTLKLDLRSLKQLKDLKIEGTNGYNSAIIPLLEAFGCDGIKTYKQYKSDVAKAKDNLLLDVLNPLLGGSKDSFLNKLAAKPATVLTKVLPNVAAYLDAHGLSQAISNLLAPVTELLYSINDALHLDKLIEDLLGESLGDLVGGLLGLKKGTLNIDLGDLSTLNLEDIVIPVVNMILKNAKIGIKLPNINWNALISCGDKINYTSKATGANGKFLTGKKVGNVDNGKVLITVLRYVATILVDNAKALKKLICSIDAVAKNDLIKSIVASVFTSIGAATPDQIIAALFYLLAGEPQNAFWDYTSYKTGKYSFTYPGTVDVDFLKSLPPMLDGLIGGLLDLNGLINEKLFTDQLISKLATGLYGAIEGVKINDKTNLTALLAQTNIDFSTANVANLLVDKNYGQTFESASATIRAAGSWKNVNADSLKWGVTDRDSFFHALVAVLRPIYGVLDVLLNDADLGLFDIVRIPGSNGYTSSIVPLMEAFSMYNIKTQYQYRQDIHKEYDAILLDIINPLWDLVEDVLSAPIQTIAAIVPNLALFIGNDGLCQILDKLVTPISALLDAIQPIVDVNDLLTTVLKALKVDLNGLLGKVGITNFKLDLYDIEGTLKPVLGADALVPLINNILGLIKIGDVTIDLRLTPIDWLQLASHGKIVVSSSQAATYGARIFVEGDSSETLIAVLRYLINTINSGNNFEALSGLIGGLIGGADDSISGVVNDVLGMLQGDTDEVISSLVDLLQTLA